MFCECCGRKMVLNTKKGKRRASFSKEDGGPMVHFGGHGFRPEEIRGMLECPSRWCRLANYNGWVCHLEYMLLDSGEVETAD